MKRFLNRRWHSIPVALVSVLLVLTLVAGGAFADLLTQQDQTITQEITGPSSIVVTTPITLKSAIVGGHGSQNFADAVTVELLGPDVEYGYYLHMAIDEASTDPYTYIGVSIISQDPNPMDERYVGRVQKGTEFGEEILEISFGPLTETGTYIFDEIVGYRVGNETGTSQVKVAFSVTDEPADVNIGPYVPE